MRPVIGIPCYSTWREDSQPLAYGNNQTYVHAVQRAGGVPLLIPRTRTPTPSKPSAHDWMACCSAVAVILTPPAMVKNR